jgi:hypothetical protein
MATAHTAGSTRFPELKPEQMTEAQKHVYEGIVGGPRGGARGPFSGTLTGSSRSRPAWMKPSPTPSRGRSGQPP